MKDNGYLIWEAGKPPDVVIEVASPNTASRDLGIKRDIYADIAVPEYWRLDPTGGDLYGEPLVGDRLVDGEYRRFALYRDADGRILSHSPAMNLDLYWDGADFGIYDPATRQYLRGLLEERRETARERRMRQAAETRAAHAEQRADREQERAAALQAELDRIRAQRPPK